MKQTVQDIIYTICVLLFFFFSILWFNEMTDSERADDYWEYEVPDTVFIHDTIYINEPTLVSERLLEHETALLERADKRADNSGKNEKLEKESEPKGEPIDSARLINEATETDSVNVKIPITERVYQDSLFRAVVRGYNPELASLDIYQRQTYYPVVVRKEYDPPNFALTIGPYMGVGNKGFNYGLAISWGWRIDINRKKRKSL